MLTLRPDQYQALGQVSLDAFVAEMERHLRQRFPQACADLGEPGLRALIHDGIDRGAGYGITDTSDLRRWLEYLVRFGRDFGLHANSWARPHLMDKALDGTGKMDALDAYDLFVLTLEN